MWTTASDETGPRMPFVTPVLTALPALGVHPVVVGAVVVTHRPGDDHERAPRHPPRRARLRPVTGTIGAGQRPARCSAARIRT
jgi:hypothetical protein